MTVVCDTREIPSGIPDMLKRFNIPVTMGQLTHGDYWIGDMPISRKADDYVSSLISNHLNNELYELSHFYEVSTLIVEGSVNAALMAGGFTRDSYLASLASDFVKRAPDGKQGVINLICVDTKWDTALLLKHIHTQVMSGEPRLPRVEKHAYAANIDPLVYVIAGAPGIGEKRALDLLNKFGGLDAIQFASVEELAEVLGPKTAENYYKKTLHRKVIPMPEASQ